MTAVGQIGLVNGVRVDWRPMTDAERSGVVVHMTAAGAPTRYNPATDPLNQPSTLRASAAVETIVQRLRRRAVEAARS